LSSPAASASPARYVKDHVVALACGGPDARIPRVIAWLQAVARELADA
jgi:hypothetical protein